MTVIEIVAGSCLLLCCAAIIIAVACQSEKGSGMSTAIMGGEADTVRGRSKARDIKLAKITKILAVVLFVVTIAVNIVSMASSRPADDGAQDENGTSQGETAPEGDEDVEDKGGEE